MKKNSNKNIIINNQELTDKVKELLNGKLFVNAIKKYNNFSNFLICKEIFWENKENWHSVFSFLKEKEFVEMLYSKNRHIEPEKFSKDEIEFMLALYIFYIKNIKNAHLKANKNDISYIWEGRPVFFPPTIENFFLLNYKDILNHFDVN